MLFFSLKKVRPTMLNCFFSRFGVLQSPQQVTHMIVKAGSPAVHVVFECRKDQPGRAGCGLARPSGILRVKHE